LVFFLFLTIVLSVDGTIPNPSTTATHVSTPACTWGKCQFFLEQRARASSVMKITMQPQNKTACQMNLQHICEATPTRHCARAADVTNRNQKGYINKTVSSVHSKFQNQC
jgi:hypothetical protein